MSSNHTPPSYMGAGCTKPEKKTNRISIQFDHRIYHEQQSKELCALHALNNLFQDATAFSKQDMDDICYSLSPSKFLNPHKSWLGLGNYDVNVVMSAVQSKGCETIWFDKRKSVDSLNVKAVMGFILNIPTDYKIGIIHLPMHRKHWIALRKIDGHYYNLDSKLNEPENIGGAKELQSYLRDQLSSPDKELLLVVSKDVAESGKWLMDNQSKSKPSENGQVVNTETGINNACDSNESDNELT